MSAGPQLRVRHHVATQSAAVVSNADLLQQGQASMSGRQSRKVKTKNKNLPCPRSSQSRAPSQGRVVSWLGGALQRRGSPGQDDLLTGLQRSEVVEGAELDRRWVTERLGPEVKLALLVGHEAGGCEEPRPEGRRKPRRAP